MKSILLVGLALVSCESAPRGPELVELAKPTVISAPLHVAPAAERAELEQLAARVDLLRVLRSHLDRPGQDPRRVHAIWSKRLQAVEDRIATFRVAFRELHPLSREDLRDRVMVPLDALRRTAER